MSLSTSKIAANVPVSDLNRAVAAPFGSFGHLRAELDGGVTRWPPASTLR